MSNYHYFSFKGKKSTDYHMRILNGLTLTSGYARYQDVEVLGRSGTLTIDTGGRSNASKILHFNISLPSSEDKSLFEIGAELAEWLNSAGYEEMEFSMYPDWVFLVKILDPISITEVNNNFARGNVTLKIYPVMFEKDSFNQPVVASGTGSITLNNRQNQPAKPLVKITPQSGSQSGLINLNGKKWIELEKLDGEIEIDSLNGIVRDKHGNAWHKLLLNELPELETGINRITFDSSQFSSVSVTPRFGRIAI